MSDHGVVLDPWPPLPIHGPTCVGCHSVQRIMSADRCCALHFFARYGGSPADYEDYLTRTGEVLAKAKSRGI